jgi:hypothetical protein
MPKWKRIPCNCGLDDLFAKIDREIVRTSDLATAIRAALSTTKP